MVGDGQCVDLFKLYWIVKEKGGYDSVTENSSWGAITEEAGLGMDFGAPVKLIYKKYLEPLDRWLWRIVEEKGIQWLWRIIEDKGLSGGLDAETKGLLGRVLDGKKSLKRKESSSKELSTESKVANTPAKAKENWALMVKGSLCNDDDDDDNDDVVILESYHANANGVSKPLKRVRKGNGKGEGEYAFGMLNWVKKIAKDPCNPAIGRALEGFRPNVQEVEYQKQACMVRKALLLRRNTCSSVLRSIFQVFHE